MGRRDPGQRLARILARFRFLSGQQECRFIGFAVARETALRGSVEKSVVSRVISRRQVVKEAAAAIEIAGATVAVSDVPHLPKERCLLPEVGSLHAAQEHIEAVGVARAVMTRKALDAQAKENPPNIRRDLINPVQTVQTFVIVGISPQSTACRNIANGIIEGEGRRETLRILGDGRNHVREDFVIWPVHLQPLLCPDVKLRFSRSEKLAKVIRPLVREFLTAN